MYFQFPSSSRLKRPYLPSSFSCAKKPRFSLSPQSKSEIVRVPDALRSSALSVSTKWTMSALRIGSSSVPIIVMVTRWVSDRPPEVVALTVYVNTKVSSSDKKSNDSTPCLVALLKDQLMLFFVPTAALIDSVGLNLNMDSGSKLFMVQGIAESYSKNVPASSTPCTDKFAYSLKSPSFTVRVPLACRFSSFGTSGGRTCSSFE